MPRSMDERSLVYSLAAGISREQSLIGDNRGKLWDSKNIINRGAPGVTVLRAPVDKVKTTPTVNTEVLDFTTLSGRKVLLARGATGYVDLLGGTMPSGANEITWSSNPSTHSMCLFREKVVICQQGTSPQLIDMVALTKTTLTNAPKGGLCAEYAGRLWIGSDADADDTSGEISVPLFGVAMPIPTITITSGTGDVIDGPELYDADTDFTAYVGKTVIIGGAGYLITGTDPVEGVHYALIQERNGKPELANSISYEILSDVPLLAIPDTASLGVCNMGVDSGGRYIRLFNRLPSTSVKVSAIRVSGAEFRAEEVPILPLTIPPGGSISVKVIGTPEGLGTRTGTLFFDHDFYAQGTVSIALSVTGSNSRVLASPSVIDFGAWIAGTGAHTPYVKVQLTNPLPFVVQVKANSMAISGHFDSSDTFPGPATDTDIPIDGALTYNLRFSPPGTDSGGVLGAMTFTRKTPAKVYRFWYSEVGDPTGWRRDIDWVDLAADGGAGGLPVGILAYDNSLYTWKEKGIWGIQPAGQFGFRGVELTLGKGLGAFSQRSICGGGGVAWFAGVNGVYAARGADIQKVSKDLEPLWFDIEPADWGKVLLTWYGNRLAVTLPRPTGSDPPSSLWLYDPSEQAWSRTEHYPNAMAGATFPGEKETLYACESTKLWALDQTIGGEMDWELTTPFLTLAGPGVQVSLFRGEVHLDDPAILSFIKAETQSGAIAYAKLEDVPTVFVLRSGAGILTADHGDLHVDEGVIGDGLLPDDAVLEVNGTQYAISSYTDTKFTFSNSLPKGVYLYRVLGTPNAGLRQRRFWLPDYIAGQGFRLTLGGTRATLTGREGRLSGFALYYGVAGETA